MGCKAATQVLQQADALKAKVCATTDLLNDSEAWTNQQQLQIIYHQVLVLDLEYALDKKVEQDLWSLCFKNYITTLQELTKDKKNPKRHDSQALLSWCLEVASGFYLTLLHELCTIFELDLPFRRPGTVFGQLKCTNLCEQVTVPQSSSCLYICQYCLVHLGDIARYRNQRQQAESFYKQAILVSPTSGQPYNQLALLEASQGNRLSTVFHYVRAISVKHPFPASATNLSTTLTSAVDKDEQITEVQTKMSVNKLTRMFLHIHGLLHNGIDLKQAEIGVKSINATLTALIATQSFTSHKLIKMTVINMYALWKVVDTNVMRKTDLTADEIKIREIILDLIAGSLSAFLLPIYTLKNDETLLDYYALPAIKLICYWIEMEPNILMESVFTNRLQIWPGFCKLLNNIQEHLKEFKYDGFKDTPLAEDKELEGFLPLSDSLKGYNFKLDSSNMEKLIRVKRLVNFGVWLTEHQISTKNVMICEGSDTDAVFFEPGCIQPDPTDQLLELMKSVNIKETIEIKRAKGVEKRGGILKPQGSLERSREEREQAQYSTQSSKMAGTNPGMIDNSKLKRVKQNVALQSIFKKIEENKQVKFIEETPEMQPQERLKVKQPIKAAISATQPAAAPLNQPYRTQTFNQNHPGLSTIHQDYFSMKNVADPQLPQNIYYQNPDPKNNLANTLSKIPQTIQFSMPPPPIPHVNMRAPPPPPKQFIQPPPLDKSMMAAMPVQMQYQNVPQPYAGWNDDRVPHPANNWWPNQQNDSYQRDNYGNLPYGMNFQQTRSVNMDYGQQRQGGMFNPWGAAPPPLGPFPSVGQQGMSMRQAMLNEATHMTPPMVNNQIAMPKPSDTMQQSNTPGYSLFDSNWTPTLGRSRTENQRSSQHHSLFSGQSHPSLMQLLEQQNQYQKNDK